MRPVYSDRRDAGRQLGAVLRGRPFRRPLVLGIPRGGVPVADEIAGALGAELDVLLVHKIGHPLQPELAIGAVGEHGVQFVTPEAEREVDGAWLERETARRKRELELRGAVYRTIRAMADVEGRDVIVTDDGAATGATMRAGVLLLRRRGAGLIVVALPAASPGAEEDLREVADDFVCPQVTDAFGAVGQFYRDFSQTSDEEVERILRSAVVRSVTIGVRRRPPSGV